MYKKNHTHTHTRTNTHTQTHKQSTLYIYTCIISTTTIIIITIIIIIITTTATTMIIIITTTIIMMTSMMMMMTMMTTTTLMLMTTRTKTLLKVILVDEILFSGASYIYALRILRSYGLGSPQLHVTARSTTMKSMLYASPAWWDFTSARNDHYLSPIGLL